MPRGGAGYGEAGQRMIVDAWGEGDYADIMAGVDSMIAAGIAEHASDDALSQREIEVLRQVADGNGNKRIAQLLGISEETVKAHMKNILSKLDANDRTHAVTIAVRRGIFDL